MSAARSAAARRSLAAIVIDTAVSARQRSPSTSCATRSSSVESTPPEKHTSAEAYPPSTSRSRACFSASEGVGWVCGASMGTDNDTGKNDSYESGDRDPLGRRHRGGHLRGHVQLGLGRLDVLHSRAGGGVRRYE